MSRRVVWGLLAIATVLVVRMFVGSASEAFWMSLPPVVLFGTRFLKAIPPPRLNSPTRAGRIVSIIILILFPPSYYYFLVFVTGSSWSWREFFLVSYFFGLSFELSLLYVYQFLEVVQDRLRQKVRPKHAVLVSVALRAAFYTVLVPYIFVIFAVHRPKLMPTPIAGIPAENIEQIEFQSRDEQTTLCGVFLKRDNPLGTVIVCHGVGANHSDIEVIHQVLFEAGFQVFTFDFRGHGLSDGHTITYGLNERMDVLGAYDACLARDDVTPDRLFALGVSMGGASLTLALPDMPKVKAAVLDSAFADLTSMVEHQFRFLPQSLRKVVTQVARGFSWIETGADINQLAPSKAMPQIDIPILIIHGDADRIVPVEHASKLHAAARNATIHIEPDSPHIGTVMLNSTKYERLVSQHFLRASPPDPALD
jgi:alpha-beta hydrolase superfamily lysophospholipase